MADLTYFHGVKTDDGEWSPSLVEGILTSPAARQGLGGTGGPPIWTRPMLQPLALNGLTIEVDAEPGALVGVILGGTARSQISLFPNDGRLLIDAAGNLIVGPAVQMPGEFSIILREAFAEAANSPRDTALTLTVQGEPSWERSIIAWGDSLTDGSGSSGASHTYPKVAEALFGDGRTVTAQGRGGQAASAIAVRQGGLPLLVSLNDDQIAPKGAALFGLVFAFEDDADGWVNVGATGAMSVSDGSIWRTGMTTFLNGIGFALPVALPAGATINMVCEVAALDLPGTSIKTGPMNAGYGAWRAVDSYLDAYKIFDDGAFNATYVVDANGAAAFGFMTNAAPSSAGSFAISSVSLSASVPYAPDAVSFKSNNILTNGGVFTGNAAGTLAGVHGTLNTDAAGNWTFNRTGNGEAEACPDNSVFVLDDAITYRDHIAWIWAGNNAITLDNASVVDALASIAAMVAYLEHDRYLVVSTLTRNTDSPELVAQRLSLNAQLAAIYGNRYVDMLSLLQENGDGSPEDGADVAAGFTPRSLRVDAVHLNDAGYAIAGAAMRAATIARGW